jgi:hypothetical protein
MKRTMLMLVLLLNGGGCHLTAAPRVAVDGSRPVVQGASGLLLTTGSLRMNS